MTKDYLEGVREGVRLAREAVASNLADPAVYTSPAITGVVAALAAIDALDSEPHDYGRMKGHGRS